MEKTNYEEIEKKIKKLEIEKEKKFNDEVKLMKKKKEIEDKIKKIRIELDEMETKSNLLNLSKMQIVIGSDTNINEFIENLHNAKKTGNVTALNEILRNN